MALAPGTRLGPYEIAALIGKGGMGEVYRARDVKLQRDVAIKILPDSFAQDTDRLAVSSAKPAHRDSTTPQPDARDQGVRDRNPIMWADSVLKSA